MSVKAFELVPAVERALLMGDKAQINIECIECCGKNLYVGTSDCFIYHFLLEEKTTSKEKLIFSVQKQQHKYLGLKKPVSELKAASALNRLIVLCDTTIMLVNMLNLDPVQSGAKIKGVVTFTVNENPVNGDPFCVELGVISVKRRTIQIYMVYEDRVQIVKELSTPEQPSAVSLDGYFLCLALTTQYIIVNYSTGASQDLFPFDTEEKKPIVKRISREEFLLAGPGGLGMFATAEGISQRAPVHWSENVIGAAICFPYVLALDEGFVTVHSMLDQQLKQTLPFRDGHIMQDFEGKVILATTKEVYMLVPLPLERQVQGLLASQRVEEAILLAEGAQRNIPKDKFLVMYRRILQQAGFIQFGQLQFLEAKDNFRKGQLDVRELISLYPLLLPSTSTFTRSHPPLHEFADLNHLAQGDHEKITKWKRFLISYLKEIRSTEVANGYKEDVDTALLKLYAEANHESLLDLLVSENFCLLVDSAPWLEKHKKYFALGLLYHCNGQDDAAVQLWVRIVKGELQDTTRPDLYEYVVDFLSFCSSQELVWKYADWALQKNQKVGVQIFTRRPVDEEKTGKLNPDDIIKYLHKYPQAVTQYLEHLVLDRKIQKEKFHTHLAVLYLDEVLQLHSQIDQHCEELSPARAKLRSLLQQSCLYRVQLVLGKIKDTDLNLERAILYGKLEEHDKALHILVHQLKDFQAAEDYCSWNSEGRDLSYRQELFHMLLAAYMDPAVTNDTLVMAAVDLLNSHAEVFDAVRVLRLVPGNWSIQLLCPFLRGAMRENMHSKRMSQVALGLAKSENAIYKHEKLKYKGLINLSEKKGCQLCHNTFSAPEFVCYPSGVLVHIHCAAKRNRDSASKQHFTNPENHT
ncbi:transforming growth factor-beta receptor-associated protein 1 homolog [Polyodon spathula]|uniref:transforming growth factor-beta receptor-associated protein 1 homolog n=1 Tax=Polyodon spathula TaxID=7913 RepID=UPI001B7EBA7B|nr:transforming growth factor-beta receptor-associated protein 1 homolog [Polyodon spathula]XP_041128040.1 transforming growth factor-beta receptor-associated protein 1 homolog [Polyodon spathula]